ncbi:MAG: hypothetical protein BGO38_00515 [Cellulomonas sp. 73-145]|uniref:Ig-like domain-containing protein n=1 Tax=Cellulomonas sp. 73-145 TaxID=1895739 RepID=UPI00092C0943|nr:Ig-like domain-containing protein [Cellulomonas sp. 73-145]MBN9326694.1 Ig-like domain repeat protein [Cellulomonas sp.]OJV60072.1 MAG: hypothetical protein BGO38_00515 [Cellulomonas sp. 73-145]
MSARLTRRLAAGATALAIAGLGLGFGATAASAVDTVPSTPTFGGSFYLGNGNTAADLAPGTASLAWNGADAPLAIGAPGNFNATVGVNPTTIGATGIDVFLSPQGQEANKTAWNAYSPTGLSANGQLQQNMTPMNLTNPGTGTPTGQGAVMAAGGDYSLGMAYTKNSDVTVVKVWYVHIHVTAGTGAWTYQPVQAAVVKTATTTTITSSPSGTVNTGAPFTLTATVSDPTATGTVAFQVGGTTIGSATVANGVATTTSASLSTAGANSVVAVYSGDSAFSGSTSAAVTVNAVLAPISTTTTVTAASADSTALHPATLTATVTPAGAAGTVSFTGSVNGGAVQTLASNVPVDATGTASVSTTGLTQGTWTINAAFTGTSPYVSSASTTAATLTLGAAAYPSATPAAANVTTTIPTGSLVITTPWSTATPLNLGTAVLDSATSTWSTPVTTFASATDQSKAIQVVDTRAGAPGFTAQVSSTDFKNGTQSFPVSFMGLVNVAAHQVANNAIQAAGVVTSNVASLSGSAQTFATYHPASSTLGTAWISGDLSLKGVPTSVQPGTYTATLTFTAF